MRYTIEGLKKIGMADAQIDAIMKMQETTPASVENEDTVSDTGNVVAFSNAKPQSRHYSYPGIPDDAGVPLNCSEVMSVTTISDLQSYAKGTLVRFPDFAEGQPFVARVRRPSMLVLAKSGKIPNALLVSANELFSNGSGGMDSDNKDMLSEIYSIMEIVCESALKEPTYQQIKDAGMELSDNQMMAIFNYTQTGVKALESFR